MLVLAAAAAAGLAVRELRTPEPFIDLGLLGGNLPLLATFGRHQLTFVVSYTFLYGDTQWLEEGRGQTPHRRHRPDRRLRPAVAGRFRQRDLAARRRHPDRRRPQGLNSLANQNALYHQADPARMGSSAGLLQTCTYLGAIIAAAAGGAFLGHGADTRGLHHRALFTLAVAVLFLVAILPDRSLRRIGSPRSSTSSTAATA